MRFYYQPSSRGLYVDVIGDVPEDAYEISEESYHKIASTAISITNPHGKDDPDFDPNWKPDWIIPQPLSGADKQNQGS